jgi:hypothetical protein
MKIKAGNYAPDGQAPWQAKKRELRIQLTDLAPALQRPCMIYWATVQRPCATNVKKIAGLYVRLHSSQKL